MEKMKGLKEPIPQTFGEDNVYLLGFSTYTGWVTAANNWGDPCRYYHLTDSLDGSYEMVSFSFLSLSHSLLSFLIEEFLFTSDFSLSLGLSSHSPNALNCQWERLEFISVDIKRQSFGV